jgi:hypothetical protein
VDTRRKFLIGVVTAATMLGGAAGSGTPQNPTIPGRPLPDQEAPPANPNASSPEKRMLDENEKDIKKKVDKLYQLASELKAQVDKTDFSKVLSLNLLKKADEIEKLARDIKNLSKG